MEKENIIAVPLNINRPTFRFREQLQYLGPAFIVSVAYIDPGNFATNISGGSIFGYSLLWVILWSNLMAIFLQIMSAKLGIATGKKPDTDVQGSLFIPNELVLLYHGNLGCNGHYDG